MDYTTTTIQLHQRWASGETLTKAEQEILEKWYAEQDAIETGSLSLNIHQGQAVDALKKQLKEMLQQVASSVQRIQQLATENEQLKRENQQLKQLLPQRLQQQPA
jgi:hypothetical protein